MERTVNQLLDMLTSNFDFDQINRNVELKKIHARLLELKHKYSHGGILGIKNSDDVISRILKYKLAV